MFQEQHRQRGQRAGQGMSASMQWYGCRFDSSAISPALPSIDGGIAVQQFLPGSTTGRADSIIGTRNRREVADDEDEIIGGPAFSDQTDDAGVGILAIDPFDAGGINISLMQGGFPAVGVIEIRDPAE